MTFRPLVSARPIEQVPQSIILIRLNVTNLFRKRLVNTNESSKTNIPFVFRGNDRLETKTNDEEKDVGEGRHCSFDSLMCFCYKLFHLVVHSIVLISVA